jgi:hypothetical protein
VAEAEVPRAGGRGRGRLGGGVLLGADGPARDHSFRRAPRSRSLSARCRSRRVRSAHGPDRPVDTGGRRASRPARVLWRGQRVQERGLLRLPAPSPHRSHRARCCRSTRARGDGLAPASSGAAVRNSHHGGGTPGKARGVRTWSPTVSSLRRAHRLPATRRPRPRHVLVPTLPAPLTEAWPAAA